MTISRNISVMAQGASSSGILSGGYGGLGASVSPTTAGNTIFTTDGTNWSSTQKIVRATAVTLTNQTSVDFTSIPSWVKRITVMFNAVSSNGTSVPIVRLGVSGAPETSGYATIVTFVSTTNNTTRGVTQTTGFPLVNGMAATSTLYGSFILTSLGSNIWNCIGNIYTPDSGGGTQTAGAKTLAGVLDLVRFTTINGTDTFDAGSVNILYE